jgi:hypothetical protein
VLHLYTHPLRYQNTAAATALQKEEEVDDTPATGWAVHLVSIVAAAAEVHLFVGGNSMQRLDLVIEVEVEVGRVYIDPAVAVVWGTAAACVCYDLLSAG